MIKKRVSELITVQEIKKWAIGDVVTITAGTGAGKSYFIKNVLYAFAKANNKKILYLINRCDTNNQFRKELISNKKTDVIDLYTYQSLENTKINNIEFDFSEYEYIVCDEAHYFISDAAFNKNTDISLNMILENTTTTKIFMSATSNKIKKYINQFKHITTIDYNLPITFDFINNLRFFKDYYTIDKLIEKCILQNEKAIIFINNTEKALELYKRYKKYSLFNCSKSNVMYKYVDDIKINHMLENEKFKENILITTSCFDTGANIKDVSVKYIVCDVTDVDSLKQCIGRKRIQNDTDRIDIYINIKNNFELGGIKSNLNKKVGMAKYLKNHTLEEFLKQYPKQNDTSNIIYDVYSGNNTCKKMINELGYFKCTSDIEEINYMLQLGNTYNYGYCEYVATELGFNNNYTIPTSSFKNTKILENYLDGVVGVKLFKEQQNELIQMINCRVNGRQQRSYNKLNKALEILNLQYKILSKKSNNMRYWIINKK